MPDTKRKVLQWAITVDYVEGQGWEATISGDGNYGPGFEAAGVNVLLRSVAAELADEAYAP
jgi:hypothetical protein